MLKIKSEDGTVREVEGLDLNVWDTGAYGSGPDTGIRLTAYPMFRREGGLWDTNTEVILFRADTNFDRANYDDEWYGYSDDMTPGDMPSEVLDLVNRILKEIQQ